MGAIEVALDCGEVQEVGVHDLTQLRVRQIQPRPPDGDDLGDIVGAQALLEEAVANEAAAAEDDY